MAIEQTAQDREMVEKFFSDDEEDAQTADDVDDLIVEEEEEEEEEPEEAPFRETATPEELYEASVKVMNSQTNHRPVFYKLLKMAETVHEGRELSSRLLELSELKYNAYPSSYFITELYNAGALDRILPSQIPSELTSDLAQEHGAASVDEPETTEAPSSSTPDFENAKAVGGSSAQQDVSIEEDDEPEDLDVPSTPHTLDYDYSISKTGRRIIAEFSPAKRIEELLSAEADLADGMHAVLTFCAKQPRSKSDIEAMLKEAGYHIGLDLDTSFYMDRLEQCGGLVWDEGWKTTEEGKGCVAE